MTPKPCRKVSPKFYKMEDDPMQEFLAREQAILGADAALFGNPMETSENHQVSPSFNAEIDQLVPSEKLVADNIVDTDLNALHDAGLGSIGDPIVMDFPTETLVAGEPSGVFGGFKEQQNLFQQPVAEQVEEKSQALM